MIWENKMIFFILFRIKKRTYEEMEYDLSNEKMFDMTIEIKGLSLLLPEYGIYKQFVYLIIFLFILFYYSDCKTIVVHLNNFILKSCLYNDKEEDNNLFRVNIIYH